MRNEAFKQAWQDLSDIQRQAAEWEQGPLLLLAGPGSGKTRVLTCRIARLLESSADKNFRILGLTFTNKAANEMKERLERYVPEQQERVFLGTFHSFCADVLRQHGTHLGIRPDFSIFSLENDLLELLKDAIKGEPALHEDAGNGQPGPKDVLGMIHRLKANLIFPDQAQRAFRNPQLGERVAVAYGAYERALQQHGALDFDSLILRTYQLLQDFPVFAQLIQSVYPYVCIDEFQDTNLCQYSLIQKMVSPDQKSIFAVADDDQIIYQWNGASHERIKQFVADFRPQVLQLPVNYRCPAEVVELANRLIQHNFLRTTDKRPTLAHSQRQANEVVSLCYGYRDEEGEADAIAATANERLQKCSSVAVLARNRRLLEVIQQALNKRGVPNALLQRKDEFLSTPLVWLHSLYRLAANPRSEQYLEAVCGSFKELTGVATTPADIILEAEGQALGFLILWLQAARQADTGKQFQRIFDQVGLCLVSSRDCQRLSREAISWFGQLEKADQAQPTGAERFAMFGEEKVVWESLLQEITGLLGSEVSLEAFLQELQMRSKEPTPAPGAVVLLTIHGAKGKEFDHVYLAGVVEDELPSFQSKRRGDKSPEMEEERRNCFVAITRARQSLTISFAEHYRGWPKEPSRFLFEMGLLHKQGAQAAA
jgi:DNA helicase II / ATP-dependent DNA helicase PcrA